MRTLTRTLVGATAAVGILAGSLASAGSGFAATEVATKPAVSTRAVSPLAVDLGLTQTEVRWLQCWLMDHWDFPGPIDGQFNTETWKALQRFLQAEWGYTGPIDGIFGSGIVRSLQRFLKAEHGYAGAIDGVWGPAAQAAMKRFARSCSEACTD
ncbi:peptidoglycan-binding protein [Streptomyces griseorubiginosus]|uniref:peptidoglycan-binding domain-containing protein n=1 Tax=Streptomyces griseorubiginosus TaxID=67304 RepID=UPI0036E9CCF3